MMIVAVLVATWVMSSAGGGDDAGEQRAVTSSAEEPADVPPVLPAVVDVAPEVLPQPSGFDFDAPSRTEVERDASLPLLTLRVTHADGEAARGAEVELYDAAQQFLARGRLDALGIWRDLARDGAGIALVLGGTAGVERFDLPELTGRHELTLPEGAVVSGRLLVNGGPPGERVPLSVRVDGAPRFVWKGFEGRTRVHADPGRWPPWTRTGLLTDDDGFFRVSGLPVGAALKFGIPQSMKLLEEFGTPLPVIAPASEVVVAARTRTLLRGRLIRPDSTAASDAELRVRMMYENVGGHAIAEHASAGGSNSWSWLPVDDTGRFEISLATFPSAWQPILEANDAPVRAGGLVREDVEFFARDTDGNWLSRSFEDIDTRVDHDLGDLVLEPAQRWRVRFVDGGGEPVGGVKVRRIAAGLANQPLTGGDDGRLDLDLGVSPFAQALVIADDHEALMLDVPASPPEHVVDIVLASSTRLELRLRGVWEDAESASDWDFVFSVSGDLPLFHDALVARRYDESAVGNDDMRAWPEGSGGRATSNDGVGHGSVEFECERPVLRFDGLRAHHPLTIGVAVRGAPEGVGPTSPEPLWEEDVWLEPGQLREIEVDLSEWFPRR